MNSTIAGDKTTEVSDAELEAVHGGELGAVADAYRKHIREVQNVADVEGFRAASGAYWSYNG